MEGDLIAFLTGPRSRKARNLEGDPRVAISIVDRDRPFTMAQVLGRARHVEGDAAWAVIDRLSRKYTGQPCPLRAGRVVLLVTPERAWARMYG
jgi:hypothetical protein